jgi:predicted transglutaminase-like cysteine proteinase
MIVKTPQTEREKLTRVNDFFNQRTRFVDDSKLWNVKDYWATPLEFLVKGAGDCEDYAIAKYFTLKALGIDDKKMRLTYVKALKLNQAHMVLTYFETPRSVPLVLDNLDTAIKPALQRKDLLPVYSFNGTGLWLAKAQGRGKKVGQSSRVNLWRDLNARMEKVSF